MATLFDPHTDSSKLSEFELLCAALEDYEPLPELHPDAVRRPRLPDRSDHEERFDTEILAGLVLP